MRSRVEIKAHISETALQQKLLDIIGDQEAREEIHKELGEYVQSYVPLKEGPLRESMTYTSDYVAWDTPYARYQYEGGDGRRIIRNYTTPGTTHHWWEKSLMEKGMSAYSNRVTNILKRCAKRLNKTW